ncbi:hypothetical protein MKX07_001756 [Trichoderma sp. CBMAI-0711]|nr:hypothetical protein MKX07_001756 [Trichoderma sp. CBMAI-0711]
MRLSGLQKEVLALYRQCLRECRKKPQDTRAHFEKFVRAEFSRNITIEKRDFAAIEFLLRKGHRQLDVYSSPGIKDIRFRFRDSAATASFQRLRPKSRVVILSRRNSRAPTPISKASPPPTSPGSVYSSDVRRASEKHHAELPSCEPPVPPLDPSRRAQPDLRSKYDGATSYQRATVRSIDEVSSLDNAWEPSSPSIDLDTFPLPPVIRPLGVPSYEGLPRVLAANRSRNPASAPPKSALPTSFANVNFSPLNTRRRPHVGTSRSPRSSHSFLDGAADVASASKHTSIDSALVEAISRSAAGLAVTSKEQKRGFPAYIARPISSKPRQGRVHPSRGKHSKVPGFDGTKDQFSSGSSGSEISFAASQDMDEWRLALIEEAPVRKQKRRPAKEKKKKKKKKHRRRWFPCFRKGDDSAADGDALSRLSRDLPPTPPPKPTPLKMSQQNQQPVRATVEGITTAREARTSIIACGSMAGGERRRRKTPLPAISIHRQARATKDRIKVSLITT